MTEPRISIAMATYNGERFLQAQLDSLATQTLKPAELVIGDDGSEDRTIDILRSFAERAPFPVRISENEQRLGPEDNFLNTAKRCRGDWISFCDQDDVWLPDRIQECVQAISSSGNDLMMIVQSAEIADSQLRLRGRRFPDIKRKTSVPRNGHFGIDIKPGFLQTFRADLIHELPFNQRPRASFPENRVLSQDGWTSILTNSLGTTLYLPEPAAIYRRHENALTGSPRFSRTLPGRVTKSLGVADSYYSYLAIFAHDMAEYLRILANVTHKPNWPDYLNEAAQLFEILSQILKLRASLYSSPALSDRIKAFCQIIRYGGYFGEPFVRLPFRSFVKDSIVGLCRMLSTNEVRSPEASLTDTKTFRPNE